MTPDKTRDKFNYVGDATNLTHANLLSLVHKIICEDDQNLIAQGNVASFHIDPENKSIDDSLITPIGNFINKLGQDKISIALCPGRLEKIGGAEQITGDTHWTGLHLRRITGDDGVISFKAYYMDSLWDKDNANFNSFYKVPRPVIRVLESFKGIGGVDFEVVKVKCDRQTDGYSCGYHAVHNLQAMHKLQIEGDNIDLTQSTNVDQFIKEERVFLKTKFNGDLDTKLRDARTKRGEGEKQGEKSKEEYESELLEIAFSDTYNNLDKLKKIIQIEDEVNQIKESVNRVTISSFLEFEKYYELFLRNFALNLQHKCSLKKELISEDEGVLSKRDIFFTKLTTDEVTKNPRKFLDILSTIDKNPKSIDTIGEIETDEDLKSEIDKRKKLFFKGITNNDVVGINYCFILRNEFDPMINRYYNSLRNEFDPIINGTFKERIDKLPINIREVSKKKIFSFSQDFKDTFEFLYENDRENLIRAMIPDYYQLMPKEKFEGWGLKAVFNGMDLTIEGKEVSQINDENGKDILNELKQDEYYKANPKLFAQAVTDFFRRATGDIDLFYNGHPSEKLLQTEKKTLKIMGGKVTDCKEKPRNLCIDSMKLFNERLESYCESPTKTPEVTPPKKDNKTLAPPLPPQPPKPPQGRQYNLNLGANNIKRYGFLGEPDSGNESGKANANKFIIVDPAGTAFTGTGGDFNSNLVRGGSKALYEIFKKRPTMLPSETKEGVGVNAKNEITTIKAGYAVYNNLSALQSGEFYGIIHAVGPGYKPGTLQYLTTEERRPLLKQTLKNIFIEYHEATKSIKEDKPGLRIPAISGDLFRNKQTESLEDYTKMFREALEEGYCEACNKFGKKIEFGQGLEICMYSQKMYDSILGEITKVPNPAISPVDAKAMEPKEKIKGGK